MHHDWILAVLEDLRDYAQLNGLPATAANADEALRVARAEVAADKHPSGHRVTAPPKARRN